ncbi:putative isopropanol dehydrogenase [Xylariales sp. PMI_506]|nr:putative isopropanol dehydrogenase [Xylariales sp. PMI_506]
MKALVLHGPGDLRLDEVPKPTAGPGAVVVRVEYAPLWDYVPEVLDGSRQYPLAYPLIFGTCCVGRVEQVGPDVTTLQPGNLVFCDYIMRLRDAPEDRIILGYHGGFTPTELKLSSGHWKDGCFAEFATFPAENVHVLDEPALARRGIQYSQVAELASVIPAMGAASAIGVSPGETVLLLPATGFFSSTAIAVLLALGATVVAGSRSQEKLDGLIKHFGEQDAERIVPVLLTGDLGQDIAALRSATPGGKGADAYIDYTPPTAVGATHIEAGLLSLKRYGRCCFAGVVLENVPVPYAVIMGNCLTIRGQFAQDRSDVIRAIRLIESGSMKLRKTVAAELPLEDHAKAMQAAADTKGWEAMVVLKP